MPNKRTCDSCTWCCYFCAVPEYNSPENKYCEHCTPGAGCSVHDSRQQVCQDFQCLWLKQDQIPEGLRPDRCGMMFEKPAYTTSYIGYTVPDSPKAYEDPDVGLLIRKITEAGNSVLVCSGRDRLLFLSEGDNSQQVMNELFHAAKKYKENGRWLHQHIQQT